MTGVRTASVKRACIVHLVRHTLHNIVLKNSLHTATEDRRVWRVSDRIAREIPSPCHQIESFALDNQENSAALVTECVKRLCISQYPPTPAQAIPGL